MTAMRVVPRTATPMLTSVGVRVSWYEYATRVSSSTMA